MASCDPTPLPARMVEDPKSTLLSETFERLYPLFLQRKLDRGPKAALWATQYHGRWVRWTGRVVSFSQNGVTLKHLENTVTFDVSLKLSSDQRAALRQQIPVGSFVTYTGRLQSYDDIFRTFYLTNGQMLDEPVDGGTLSPPFVQGTQPVSSGPP